MANTLLTITMITREAVRLWKNSNAFLKSIDTQYDDSFAKNGAKIGTTLKIRLPNDYTVRTGAVMSVQDTAEQSTTMTLATQKGVDVSFNSVERTMELDDYSERVLAPMVNNLAGAVAADVMSGVEGGISNFVANTDASGAVLTPTAETWLLAGAKLDDISCPRGKRKIIMDPLTQARTVSSLSGLFNPARKVGDQYESGEMQQALGFDWFMDQTVLKHTTATYTASGSPATVCTTVNGASQTGSAITVAAITGGLAAGDIVTFETTYAVNRITKTSTGQLRQFVVTAAVATGGTSIPIYPALTPAVAGVAVQYQTVDASPANGDDVRVVTLSAVIYRKNFAFAPEAVTLATADLELPKGVHEAARENLDGCSMRMVTFYAGLTDQFATRLDILYGYKWVRPEWACVIADKV